MPLRIHNTLTHKIEEFKPGHPTVVNLYTCGPTLYDHAHIGNMRSFVFADILKRVLEYNSFDVEWVMNITDVDDKTIAKTIEKFGSTATPTELAVFTDPFFQTFQQDLEQLNISPNNINFVKATALISDMQLYIIDLIKKGYAYKTSDGVYFDIAKYQSDFGDYGVLVGPKFIEGRKTGTRVAVDEYEKDNIADFALWKGTTDSDGLVSWDHPELGPGRPGWHIECTLINYFKFEHGTDIHTGGIDLIFPHHTNEIAQAQSIYKPFVTYWMHSEHILVENRKMSKSLGNYITISDLLKTNPLMPMAFRYLLLQGHYRTRFNVTKESLQAALQGLKNLITSVKKIASAAEKKSNNNTEPTPEETTLVSMLIQEFSQHINNDLNTTEALAVLQRVMSSELSPAAKLKLMYKMDEVFGLDLEHATVASPKPLTDKDLPIVIKNLVIERTAARKAKDFQTSDKIRSEIEKLGYQVIDSESTMSITKKE